MAYGTRPGLPDTERVNPRPAWSAGARYAPPWTGVYLATFTLEDCLEVLDVPLLASDCVPLDQRLH